MIFSLFRTYINVEGALLFSITDLNSKVVNMKSPKNLLFCSLVIFASRCVLASVKLDLHIGSLCRFSSIFIRTQFAPSFEAIKHDADIDFHIYGKSETIEHDNGSPTFICQHGDWECEKNINMTCVLHFLGNNTDLKAQFVICAMDFTRAFPWLDPECTREVGVDQSLVDSCAVTRMGLDLQREVGLISGPIIEISHRVPTIVYNKVYSERLSSISQTDFLNTFNGLAEGTIKLPTAKK